MTLGKVSDGISDGSGITRHTRRSVTSETSFDNRASLEAIRKYLRTLKANGTLHITFAQGGVNEVRFSAIHRINGDDHVEIAFTPGPLPELR